MISGSQNPVDFKRFISPMYLNPILNRRQISISLLDTLKLGDAHIYQ